MTAASERAAKACGACDGEGWIEERTGCYRGWNGVVEPTYSERPCETCGGTGEVQP